MNKKLNALIAARNRAKEVYEHYVALRHCPALAPETQAACHHHASEAESIYFQRRDAVRAAMANV